MQKPLGVIWNFLLELAFFSGCYVYVELFNFNGNENNLLTAVKIKSTETKQVILEENLRQHLRGFYMWTLQILHF